MEDASVGSRAVCEVIADDFVVVGFRDCISW